MKTPSISLCMIVKNERNWIGASILSVRELVSEVVVVDTGSEDGTPDIARALGAKVIHFPWVDDFSSARNRSIAEATGEWILVLDADEVLDPEGCEKIKAWLQIPTSMMASMVQTTYSHETHLMMWRPNDLTVPEAQGFSGYLESRLIRLFHRDPKINFVNCVHEQVVCSDRPEDRGAPLDIRIHHYGQVRKDPKSDKKGFYWRLGKKRVAENPQQFDALYDFAVASWEYGQWQEAQKYFRLALRLVPGHFGTLLALAALEKKSGNTQEEKRLLQQVRELHPEHPYIVSRFGKKLVTERCPSLSLCMIVRNEERWLASCLKNVSGLVDEIVIVDTGSTDRTLEIAQSFHARVVEIPWPDDFSKARNVSLEHARGDWILVLDADEMIALDDQEKIRQLIQQPKSDLYWMTQTTYIQDSATFNWIPNRLTAPEARDYPGYVESVLVRLFRRTPMIRFQGIVHEHAVPSDPFLKPVMTDIRIHHYGKYSAPEVNAKKENMYLKLGEIKCRDNPHDAHAFYELGIQYWGLKEPEKAIEALHRAEQLAPSYVRPQIGLAAIATAQKDHAKALRHYAKIMELDPANVDPYLAMPPILVELKKFSLADHVLQLGEKYARHHPAFHINRGFVKQAMGNHRGAATAFREALHLNPGEPLAYYNLGISQMELGQTLEAFTSLEKASQFGQTRCLALRKMADGYFRERQFEKALSCLATARQCKPSDDRIFIQMAIVLIRLGRFFEAEEELSKIESTEGFDKLELEHLQQCRLAVKGNVPIQEKGEGYDVHF